VLNLFTALGVIFFIISVIQIGIDVIIATTTTSGFLLLFYYC
jgi:hypothetical protein